MLTDSFDAAEGSDPCLPKTLSQLSPHCMCVEAVRVPLG